MHRDGFRVIILTQQTIDEEYKRSFASVKRIVMDYLAGCYSCRNDRMHLGNHIHKKYPLINSETIRRTAQLIQNTQGLYIADKEVQNARQAKELWMRDNIKKL